MSNEKNPDAGALLALVELHAGQDFLSACNLDPAPVHVDRGNANMRSNRRNAQKGCCSPSCEISHCAFPL